MRHTGLSTILLGLALGIGPSLLAESHAPNERASGRAFAEAEAFGRETRVAVAANNRLAFSLFERLKKKDENLVFSPLSTFFALAMLYNATGGETRKEILAVLATYRLTEKDLNQAAKALLASLSKGRDVTLASANLVATAKDVVTAPDFSDRVSGSYDALVKKLSGDGAKDLAELNEWVKGKTKIPKILEGLDPNTKLILANATRFEGDWTQPFSAARNGSFDGKSAKMMAWGVRDLRYAKQDDFQMIELPYGKEGSVTMNLILPPKKSALDISPTRYKNLLDGLKTSKVGGEVPKFSFQTEKDLTRPLKALGVQRAFGKSNADFSRLTSTATGGQLALGQTKHVARIDVHEMGTDASAVTVLSAVAASMPRPEAEFIADRPFLFTIQDKKSGAILFMGAVENIPEARK